VPGGGSLSNNLAKLKPPELDTRAVARDRGGAILLDPGTHELVIEAPNHEAVTRSIGAMAAKRSSSRSTCATSKRR